MIDPARWKEVSRRRLTPEEAAAYIEGNTCSSPGGSFDMVTVTEFKKNPFRCLQIVYERNANNGQ